MTAVALHIAAPLNLATPSVSTRTRLHVAFGNVDHYQFSASIPATNHQINPNTILDSYPNLKLGREFSVHHPLNPNEPLKWHVKVALAPIGFYHFMTRHNPWWGKAISKEGHVSCMFADGNSKQMSCSEYTAMAIKVMGQRNGVVGSIKGWAYGLWRIIKCNPLSLAYRYFTGHLPKDPVW